jgi:hypothetical protein
MIPCPGAFEFCDLAAQRLHGLIQLFELARGLIKFLLR